MFLNGATFPKGKRHAAREGEASGGKIHALKAGAQPVRGGDCDR